MQPAYLFVAIGLRVHTGVVDVNNIPQFVIEYVQKTFTNKDKIEKQDKIIFGDWNGKRNFEEVVRVYIPVTIDNDILCDIKYENMNEEEKKDINSIQWLYLLFLRIRGENIQSIPPTIQPIPGSLFVPIHDRDTSFSLINRKIVEIVYLNGYHDEFI
jgi:hypothetical protein